MKNIARLILVMLLFGFSTQLVFAQGLTLLPGTDKSIEECTKIIFEYESSGSIPSAQGMAEKDLESKGLSGQYCDSYGGSSECSAYNQAKANPNSSNDRDVLLACGIKTGRISFSMVPYYITYIANFLLALIGLIAVLFIVIGGYNYIWGGLSDAKEKGKKTITHALAGVILAVLSWVIVQLIVTVITS